MRTDPDRPDDGLDCKINELERIIAELENEGTSLERGIELFEKGVALTRECLGARAG